MGDWGEKIIEFIRSDFQEWGEESCLYEFLEQEKARKGNGKRKPTREQLMRYARDWIYNRGKSVKGGDTVARSAGIPIGLVKCCLLRSADLRADLGLAGSQRAGGGTGDLADDGKAAKGRDLERLYRSIVVSNGDCSSLVVPIEIDSASGMGLYLLGCGFANGCDRRVVERVFRQPIGLITRPFLAIIRHHWNMSELKFAPLPGNFPEGDQPFTFWNDVVTAWVPKGRNFGFKAYVQFSSEQELEGSLMAYALNNKSIEKLADCPERFRQYFEA